EALNKAFGTDILISEYTWELVKDHVITKLMPSIKVKGKTDPLKIYAVINYRGLKGPQTLTELRKVLGIAAPTAGKVDTDKEEVKYEILED
ncbi:MAG: adenylate/guanylate cyclase domain-containing protein, partial [Spirochaetales bacterium]|nr:adenylate/guanylate cyclase domain-containing protein [Spirochaetales bacterium]